MTKPTPLGGNQNDETRNPNEARMTNDRMAEAGGSFAGGGVPEGARSTPATYIHPSSSVETPTEAAATAFHQRSPDAIWAFVIQSFGLHSEFGFRHSDFRKAARVSSFGFPRSGVSFVIRICWLGFSPEIVDDDDNTSLQRLTAEVRHT